MRSQFARIGLNAGEIIGKKKKYTVKISIDAFWTKQPIFEIYFNKEC